MSNCFSAYKIPVLFFAAIVSLSACSTISPEQIRQNDMNRCSGYGFRENTQAFAECRQRIDLDRAAGSRLNQLEMDHRMNRRTDYLWYGDSYRYHQGYRPSLFRY